MRKNVTKRAIIIILIAALFLGTAGAAIWKLAKSTDNITDPFVLLSEGFTDRKIVDEASALAAIGDVATVLGIEDVNSEFSSCEVSTVSSNTYYRFQQEYKDIPVYGRSVVVIADKNGNSLSLSGNYLNNGHLDTSPKVDEKTAIKIAQQYYGENVEVSRVELSVYSFSNNKSELSWKILIHSNEIMEWCFISAISGELLSQNSLIYTETVRGSGENVDGKLTEFNILLLDYSLYSLEDNDRNIHIFNADRKTLIPNLQKENDTYTFNLSIRSDDLSEVPLVPLANTNSMWKDTKAVTSIERASAAYDFFRTKLHRTGFNGKNGRVNVVYNDFLNGDTTNAYSSGGITKQTMLLSFGTDNSMDYDTFGHEFTHAVEQSISGMIYEGESGAIMEAYSDIFGEIIEDWVNGDGILNGNCDWMHGQSRSLAKPTSIEHQVCYYEYNGEICPIKEAEGEHIQNTSLTLDEGIFSSCQVMRPAYPDYYQGEAWHNTTAEYDIQGRTINDYGGVHTNNTVISHAAYLMWKGIDGSDAFEPLTTEELANLFYETLYTLPSDCTFSQFRALVQNTAEYQDLSTKQRLCISNAFFQVGITSAAVPVVKDHLAVDIYGIDGLPYNDYTLHVRYDKTENTYDGETIKAEGITFPELGEYQLRIVDNANTDNQTTVTVLAVERGGAKTIPIFTECGVSKPNGLIGTDIELPLETDTANIDIINSAESALQDFTLTESGSLTNISSERGSESLINWSSTYNVVGYKSDSLNASSEISVTNTTSGVNHYTNEPYSDSRNYLFAKRYKDGMLSCDISSYSSLPFVDTEMSPINFMNLCLPDSECILDVKKDSDGNDNKVFTITLQADAITSTNANILGHLIDSLSGMQYYINWTDDPEYGADGGFDEVSMTVTLDHDNRLKSIVIESIVNIVMQDYFKASCTLEYNFNYDAPNDNTAMSEQEIYEKLVSHYKKGTEDSDGSDLAVMQGSIQDSIYGTMVRCGMPGNPSASQPLYDVQVDIYTGDVTQIRILTDNKVTKFNIKNDVFFF